MFSFFKKKNNIKQNTLITEINPNSVRIDTFNNYLILTILDNGPKIKYIGNGTLLNINSKNDLLISKEALELIKTCSIKENPSIEFIDLYKIYWFSDKGIISLIDDVSVIELPLHTIVENNVTETLKEKIKNI
jgi:hypothetical protein